MNQALKDQRIQALISLYNNGDIKECLLRAKKVAKIIPCKIKVKKNFDIRSYRQNSDKLLGTGFKRKHSVEDAIFDIKNDYQKIMKLDINKSFTVKWLKKLIQKSKVK